MMIDKGEFFLKGYSNKQTIDFSFIGHAIQLNVDSNEVDKLEKLDSELKMVETATLTISGPNDQESLRSIAIDIKNLLSIALGKRIVFDRQRYWHGDKSELIEKSMSKNENCGEQIIPDFEIKNYLQKTLPNWTQYSKLQKDDIFTITDYLNQTSHDFIEDRILRTVQAWECAANYWIEEMELSAELNDLKGRIKQTYRQWIEQTKFHDKDGELGKRLTSPLDQEKLMLRLARLIEQCGLVPSKINLELKKLKDLRDQVAHTGRIRIGGSEAIKFLQPGINGLQLILLKRLGYDGLVNGEKDNWKTIEKISDYFE